MSGIVIVVHTPMGGALLNCATHVLGEVKGIAVHDVLPDDMPEDAAPLVLADILRADRGAGVLVLTDLVGATPANIAKRAVADARAMGVSCSLVAGVNTPMLLRAVTNRDLSLSDICEKALAGGVQGCLRVD